MPEGDDHRPIMAEQDVGVALVLFRWSWTAVFAVRNPRLRVREAVVEGKRGSVMPAIVAPVHNNPLPHIAAQRCLF